MWHDFLQRSAGWEIFRFIVWMSAKKSHPLHDAYCYRAAANELRPVPTCRVS